MALTTLVYVSVASNPMADADLTSLLKFARANNEKKSITGMLLFRDGLFVQALEGDEQDINALFAKIEKDSRHKNVTKLYVKPIKQRYFGDWSMGFAAMNDNDLARIDGYSDFLDNPGVAYFSEKPGYAQALLENFKIGYLMS